jgi:hypothetical protein
MVLRVFQSAAQRGSHNSYSYKLDDVAGNFISDDIVKIQVDEETKPRSYTQKNIAGLRKGDYIHIEITGFTSDYYKDGAKSAVRS